MCPDIPSVKPHRAKYRNVAAVWMRMCLRCSAWLLNLGMPGITIGPWLMASRGVGDVWVGAVGLVGVFGEGEVGMVSVSDGAILLYCGSENNELFS